MTHVKKMVSVLLALVIVLSFGVTVFAEGEPTTPETGSVTINGALNGNTFTLYKIFDLESYDADARTYAYTIDKNSPLYPTVKNMTLQVGNMSEPMPVFTLSGKADSTTTEYVQLAPDFLNAQNDDEEINAIAAKLMEKIDSLTSEEKALLYWRQIAHLGETVQTTVPADSSDITTEQYTGGTTPEENKDKYNIKFSNLGLGYYLVDSSAGTMLGLTTTKPNAEITAKNVLPSVKKEVRRNVDGEWNHGNSKKIGETVDYRVQIGVKEGATNYVIYDSMSNGLTFDKITKVYYGYPTNVEKQQAAHTVYDVNDPSKGNLNAICNYATDVTYKTMNCCFKMDFKDTFLEQVLNDTHTDGSSHKNTNGYNETIYVEYTAVLNENAVIGEYPTNLGNPNDVYLTYGENDVEVGKATVRTMTYQMELVKTNANNTVITGAEFEVYNSKEDAQKGINKIQFVKDTSGAKTIYRVATEDETKVLGKTVTTIEAGDVIIKGLGGNFKTDVQDVGRSYFFKEIKAPDGYTLLPSPREFKIEKSDYLAKVEADTWVSGGLHVINNSGSLLPSTGGIGTTIFYVVGSILLIGAGVLLITKKRMNSEK